jgi:AraC-like DNA-binding protein
VLEEIAGRELAERSSGSIEERVRAVVQRLGFDRTRKIEQVAAELGMSARKLQRGLAEEGATQAEVAFRLEFSSRSSLHHATQRWTGKRPGELRVKVKAPARTRK